MRNTKCNFSRLQVEIKYLKFLVEVYKTGMEQAKADRAKDLIDMEKRVDKAENRVDELELCAEKYFEALRNELEELRSEVDEQNKTIAHYHDLFLELDDDHRFNDLMFSTTMLTRHIQTNHRVN